MANATSLDRGWRRAELVRELAIGSKTHETLAAERGCSRQTITAFAKRWAADITKAAEDADNEFAALWIARKANRIAEYERDAEAAQTAIDEYEKSRRAAVKAGAEESDLPPDPDVIAKLTKVKHRALRSAAEELGALPTRASIQFGGKTSKIIIDGVNADDI